MSLTFKWIPKIADIAQPEWDTLATPLSFPFLEWDWLNALEVSGCVGGKTGWLPFHLTGWRDNQLVAAAPLYVKAHSWGEFVFDQSWARAALSYGLPYYPKLIGMSPFTPIPGYRFLIAPGEDNAAIQAQMFNHIDEFCSEHRLGGFHLLHIEPEWQAQLAEHGFHSWLHHGLVWHNQGFGNFDDYLGQFRSHRRKTIRRERRRIAEQDIHYETATGEQITPSMIQAMYGFYSETCIKYWGGSQYLTADLFQLLQRKFNHRLVLMQAYSPNHDERVAMSLLIRKGSQLYGRYWGCHQDLDGLHFETCYYQPIQWAIDQGIESYDAGSGGARHKYRRGFPAESKYSLHRLYDPQVDHMWQHNIERVNREEQLAIDNLSNTR